MKNRMDYCAALAHVSEVAKGHSNTYQPHTISNYQYWAKVTRIVDADTLDLEVSIGFELYLNQRFRLIGINAPEIHSVKRTSREYAAGLEAADFVARFAPVGTWIETEVYLLKREKYGRWLCQVFKDGVSLNASLIANDFAEPV